MNRPRLRVALVSEHADPLVDLGTAEAGGQNVYVAALARELGRVGCLVDVYTRHSDPRAPTSVRIGPRVTVRRVPCGPAGPIGRDDLFPFMPEFAERLSVAWQQRRPDVVHAHFWMSGWAATAAADHRTPVVQTFHALGSVKRRHQGCADTSPPERIETERQLLRHVDAVIATCRDEVDELRRLGNLAPTFVVPCGVTAVFSPLGPIDATPRRRRHRLLAVSRIVPRKGIADVVEALPLVPHAELVVVGGETDDDATSALRSLTVDLGVADRVDFRGHLPAEDVAAIMRSADAVVCAPWYEPFGIVPVEALACGVPVIGTAVGGLLDTVHPDAGVLVPPRSPAALATAMRALLADPARRRRMSASAAVRAQRYRWPGVAAGVLDVYHGTVGDRSRHEAALA